MTGLTETTTAAVGLIIGSIGFGINLNLDLLEGDVEGVASRVFIEVGSFGMVLMVTKAGADKAAREMTDTVLGKTVEAIDSVIKKYKKENNFISNW